MVRPRFGPPRFKPRPFADGPGNSMSSEVHYAPHSKGRRNDQDYAASGPPNWRESRGGRGGRGRPPFSKRSPLMGERREPPFNNHWKSPNQNSFQSHPSQMDPRHGRPSPSGHSRPSPSSHNRPSPTSHGGPSPSRPVRSPHAPHRSSSHSPVHVSPAAGHRSRPPFHGPPSSSHRSSPRQYHGHSADRPPSPNHGSFRAPKRPPPFPQKEQQRGRDPRGHQSPRERPYEHSPHGNNGKPWSAAGGAFSHQHNGEHGGPSGSQRKPREPHGRGSYPERWPAVQDARKQHGGRGGRGGGVARDGGRPHSAGRTPESHSNPPPYRPPPWKGGPPPSSPSSSYHHGGPPERHGGEVSRKRSMPFPPPPLLEHGPPKHPRREGAPSLFSIPRPFGGRPLSLRDKSRIMKGRQLRAESVLRLRPPPPPFRPRPNLGGSAPKGTPSSLLALRKKRFQTDAAPAAKTEPQKRPRKSSSPNPDTNESSRDSDTATEQVESQRSLSARSSSPIDKHLSSDLVVVSHWQAAPSSSSSQGRSSPPKERNKFKTERNSNPDASYSGHRGRYIDMKSSRPMNALHEIHRPGRPFRRPAPGPGHNPRMRFIPTGGPRRPAPVPLGNFRKPLMESFVPRPFPQQTKPVFRKSQSIMSKYRTIQQARQRAPYNRGPNQRW